MSILLLRGRGRRRGGGCDRDGMVVVARMCRASTGRGWGMVESHLVGVSIIPVEPVRFFSRYLLACGMCGIKRRPGAETHNEDMSAWTVTPHISHPQAPHFSHLPLFSREKAFTTLSPQLRSWVLPAAHVFSGQTQRLFERLTGRARSRPFSVRGGAMGMVFFHRGGFLSFGLQT